MPGTRLLFLEDSYAKEADAHVIEALAEGVILDQTIFYYSSGGQPCDIGVLLKNGKPSEVKEVLKKEGKIIHFLSRPHDFAAGDLVHLKIDWERRYKLMRTHTAAHILSSVMFRRAGILVTGNQLGTSHTRFDFNMKNFDRAFIEDCILEASNECAKGHGIKTYSLAREEAMKIEGVVKLAGALPPSLSHLRIVQIGNIDTQADGGTHVRNTQEVGKIIFEKAENKGAENRRIYFKLSD